MPRWVLWATATAAGWMAVTSLPPTVSGQSPAALAASDTTVLTPGMVLERPLRAGEHHRFSIELTAGDFLHVVVDQRGVDVSVQLSGPDSTLLTADTLNDASGPERVAWIAGASGVHVIDVSNQPPAAALPLGRYQLRVEARRPATEGDRSLARASRLMGDAAAAYLSNTAASRDLARERFTAALEIFERLDMRYEQGLCLFGLGVMDLRAGQARRAAPVLTRARTRFEPSDPMSASVLNALGGAFDLTGDPESAMTQYRQALAFFVSAGDRGREAVVRNNIGKLHADMADWPRALEQYRLALPLFQQLGNRRREALALYNIGASYTTMDERTRAAEYLQQSLAISRAIGDKAGEADTLTLLGLGATMAADTRTALDYFQGAMPLRQVVGDRRAGARTLAYLGRAQLLAGDVALARESLQRAVDLWASTGDKRGHALALENLADAYTLDGNPWQGLERSSEAVAMFRGIGDRRGLGLALPAQARALRRLGRADDALGAVRDALAAIEDVRGGVSSPEMRASYLGRSQSTYGLAIELLMQLDRERPGGGFDALALQMNERTKARSLLDMLAESGTELRRGAEPGLVERERQLGRLLDAKADRLVAAQAARSESEADTLAKEAQALEAEYEEVRARIRASSPEYSALTQPQPLDVEGIRRDVLADDTTLVEYALGEEASYVWVLDRRELKTYRLAARAEIERAARDAYELVTSRARSMPRETPAARTQRIAASDAALPTALQRVSDLVLAPIAAFPTTTRLLVVADGALQYLPFEMLPAPRQPKSTPLVTRFEITALPSASTLAVHRAQIARRAAPTKGVAVFADPVFDGADPRVRQTRVASAVPAPQPGDAQTRILTQTDDPAAPGFGSIARLQFTGDEAKAILAAARGRQNLAAIGFDASKTAATDTGLGAYRYLHFATHGFLDTARPSLSAIALSLVGRDGAPQEGFLRAHELYNLNLSADLVVLSACETGLGKEIRGEGLIGLTRAFMYAGAARVIVSLWSVSDRATASLMGRLYQELLRDGQTPSASLRAAQLALRTDARWQHPYYWAAFTIQGDWR